MLPYFGSYQTDQLLDHIICTFGIQLQSTPPPSIYFGRLRVKNEKYRNALVMRPNSFVQFMRPPLMLPRTYCCLNNGMLISISPSSFQSLCDFELFDIVSNLRVIDLAQIGKKKHKLWKEEHRLRSLQSDLDSMHNEHLSENQKEEKRNILSYLENLLKCIEDVYIVLKSANLQ